MAKKRSPRRKKVLPPVSLGGNCIEDGLPYPVVHYPNHYGAFFAFSEAEGGDVIICECNRSALDNLIELNKRFQPQRNSNPLRETTVDSFNAPDVLAKISLDLDGSVNLENFSFRPKICHRCNLIPPTQRFCHEMYGGQFKQSFGWYIQQSYLRLGISTTSFQYLDEVCPTDYQSLIQEIESAQDEFEKEYDRVHEFGDMALNKDNPLEIFTSRLSIQKEEKEQYIRLRKKSQELKNQFKNKIENIVRQEFGFKKVGEGWVSETLLYQIISRVFPEHEIIRHHRPDWLERLELDIYIPSLQLGVEYQGQQHYQPVSIWGGETALIALQERDERKRAICKTLDITLMEVDYTEPLTYDHIHKRLKDAKIL
ncbi:MAG: hypothetical protein ACJAZP_003867 [Psychromonas sp.]|jgi:hypothetical protein|uniref:hypothetical protein n=1 Tax=Psychromonas sp. TaxID=1884585 RepID=UPI0039E44628